MSRSIVGVIGSSAVGKTTLLRQWTGQAQLEPLTLIPGEQWLWAEIDDQMVSADMLARIDAVVCVWDAERPETLPAVQAMTCRVQAASLPVLTVAARADRVGPLRRRQLSSGRHLLLSAHTDFGMNVPLCWLDNVL